MGCVHAWGFVFVVSKSAIDLDLLTEFRKPANEPLVPKFGPPLDGVHLRGIIPISKKQIALILRFGRHKSLLFGLKNHT
jgi:hypothetical protein